LDALLDVVTLPSDGVVEAAGKDNALVGPTLADKTSDQAQSQVATKADDAEIPMHIWDERLLPNLPQYLRAKIPLQFISLRCNGGEEVFLETFFFGSRRNPEVFVGLKIPGKPEWLFFQLGWIVPH
jgi:hypothetical protein